MKRAPILILTLCLAACAKGEADKDPTPTALVTTAVATQARVDDTVTAYGAAEFDPGAEHSLTAPVEATVAKIIAPPGTRVRAGDPVVALTASPASALDLQKAKTDAAAADAALDRALRLKSAGLDSDADVESARATALAADGLARSLSARAGSALTLRAPTAGVVESIALAPDDLAAQGAAVAKIGDLNGLRVRLGLEAQDAAVIQPGAGVLISATAGNADEAASVSGIDPRLDPQTRLASALVVAAPGLFVPGEPVKGVIVLHAHPAATVIPRAAVLYDQEQAYVFVVQASAAHRRDVKLGAEDGDLIAVSQGLTPGERVVVAGASALDDGMAVREGQAAASAPASPAASPAASDDK